MTSIAKGSCLCGEVSYEITGSIGIFQYCHCSRCRKVTGSAHGANIFTSPNQFKWLSGETNVCHFSPADAKYFATSFCKHCSSALPWLSKNGKTVIVPAGTLDDDPGIKPIQNIFCASKADWYVPAGDLSQYDELPLKK